MNPKQTSKQREVEIKPDIDYLNRKQKKLLKELKSKKGDNIDKDYKSSIQEINLMREE